MSYAREDIPLLVNAFDKAIQLAETTDKAHEMFLCNALETLHKKNEISTCVYASCRAIVTQAIKPYFTFDLWMVAHNDARFGSYGLHHMRKYRRMWVNKIIADLRSYQ